MLDGNPVDDHGYDVVLADIQVLLDQAPHPGLGNVRINDRTFRQALKRLEQVTVPRLPDPAVHAAGQGGLDQDRLGDRATFLQAASAHDPAKHRHFALRHVLFGDNQVVALLLTLDHRRRRRVVQVLDADGVIVIDGKVVPRLDDEDGIGSHCTHPQAPDSGLGVLGFSQLGGGVS